MLNDQQKIAFEIMKSGENCFITGNPGTGKSYLVNEFTNWAKKANKSIMACAPTGIAAININGSTLHRALRIPTGPLVDNVTSIPSVLKDTDIMIIDEISMVRIDLFDYVAKTIVALNNHRDKVGNKRLQLIVVGDFFQLPPVISDRDKEVLECKYGKQLGRGYAFQSGYWNILKFKNIVLKDQMRQSNPEFIKYLSYARMGNYNSIYYFNNKASEQEIKNAILLCGTNRKAETKNEKEFNKLETPIKVFKLEEEGVVSPSDKVVPDELKLRVGCRVIMMINDSAERFSNGSFGTVSGFKGDKVKVIIDDGCEVFVEKNTWEIKTYSANKNSRTGRVIASEEVIGSYTQLPLKLAYAITIHKSQGQTYDKVNLDPYSWDCGQLYVALSRVKSIDGLHLTNIIIPKFLITSDIVKQFYNSLE